MWKGLQKWYSHVFRSDVRTICILIFYSQTSKTFPSLCRATLETTIAHLEAVARVTTIDYNGIFQDRGGDPVSAELRDDVGEMVCNKREVK